MRRRRSLDEPQENRERWLVSYADFITLLFAFFTTLYAISVVDAQKAEKLVHSIRESFGTQILDLGTKEPGVFEGQVGNPIPLGIAEGTGHPASIESQRLDLLGRRVRERPEAARLGDRVRVRRDERGLVISLADTLFFGSGGRGLSDEALEAVAEVAALLRDVPNHVQVEGHTDDRPATGSSNWELSAARAVQVVRTLESRGVPASRLSAAGFAEHRPLASNATSEGRAENRRVDLVVLRARTAGSRVE